MKRLTFLILTYIICIPTSADEGMWLPQLLKQLNLPAMQSLGLKLSAEDIYDINQSSLKDAIVSFGGYCTGEIISKDGLLLTNHHCGFSSIQGHSSVEKDYITDGFWAKDRDSELTNPGLTATFIVRIDDVSSKILEGVSSGLAETERQRIIESNIEKVGKAATLDTDYNAVIKPFYFGAEYYMFITETYQDVRLVAAPPRAIGNFGGDLDNWMWPRHTGDFSLFRIYAGKDNKPAPYSKDNIPYTPKKNLSISLKGVQEGDFTFVYGFPGRTTEYLTSYEVDQIINLLNPAKIKIRDMKLNILQEDMMLDAKVRIQYASKYARISNYHKKWQGETNGLIKLNALDKKKSQEIDFKNWIKMKNERVEKYGDLFENFETLYQKRGDLALTEDYITEAAWGIELVAFSLKFRTLVKSFKHKGLGSDSVKILKEKLIIDSKKHFKNYNTHTDKKLLEKLLKTYIDNVNPVYFASELKKNNDKYKGNLRSYSDFIFSKSLLTNEEKTIQLIQDLQPGKIKLITEDPGFKLSTGIQEIYENKIYKPLHEIEKNISLLHRDYVAGLREMKADKTFYPDANGTLRVTYGKVARYTPRDGVEYKYFTTAQGIVEKNNSRLSSDYALPERMKELLQKKEYGRYGKDGKLVVCFIGTNHTTGGNSGSPVLNGEGHLIGLNFDRSWESTMSDIMYDPDLCRNIAVDIGYVLFVIDKFGGAGYLVDEMDIIE